ncbi:MAG TPA: imidazole glycerol phosphate synthase subunit HisF [Candidatus Coprenecus pullistercoris]|nr:imidazole glycerol phosphate synthase subunit HisF [Candidatus Coprenecus pullistercoris]
MLTKRIIPCLDIKDGQTVKGINFLSLKTVGDPVELAAAYSAQGADELVLLDISATLEGRKAFTDLVERIALRISIPFTVGGGISTADDAAVLLKAGADKVSVNSGAVRNPALISEMASRFGSQCVVVAIDARKADGQWRVTTHGGSRLSDKELFSWAVQAEKLGAGEILFTSMDHDGTCNGYACGEYRRLSSLLGIPVIASGGAGAAGHIAEVLSDDGGRADAALAASVFHYGEIRIPNLKRILRERNIPVRPCLPVQQQRNCKSDRI